MEKQIIKNNLREYRLKAGLTQEVVVKAIGLQSNNRLCRWEQGKAYPSIVNLLKLSKIYKVPCEALYQI
ncbi:MAG TPA: helix-turn-helix transcriptional regulator [Cytophagales bacterium]|nr:helix-turn-helix transcriptional regulator [Cytophagales bacterium]